jgi:hypothetical protein
MSMSICYIAAVVISIGITIWGLLEILRKKQDDEPTINDTISRQIKGFGFLILSQIVLFLGISICFGFGGGADAIYKGISKMF